MDTITLDRKRAVDTINSALKCVNEKQFDEAMELFQRVLHVKDIIETGGAVLWETQDKIALGSIYVKLFCRAETCVKKAMHNKSLGQRKDVQELSKEALNFCRVLSALDRVTDDTSEKGMHYIEGLAYELSDDLEAARISFKLGVAADPRCKKGMQRVGAALSQKRGW